MEHSRFQKVLPSNTMEPRNGEFQPGLQPMMQDRPDDMHTIRRPPNVGTAQAKPVLNFSIQTGEEFALEFMRDRVNLGKPMFPNVGDTNYTPGYMDLKGILGISHPTSESGSDISMLSMVDKYPKEFERVNTSLQGDKSNYGSIRSIPRTSMTQDSRQLVQKYGSSRGSDSSSMLLKFLCSFGGRILPRPSDGKLRYVGGDTRILRIRKNISWQELLQKALLMYSQVHAIKYQLPGEDLDALVSVSCDEDLQNMMEECNHLEDREGSQKPRMFLFSLSDLEDAQFGLSGLGDDSEIQYVVAVNGMDMGSRRNSTLIGVNFSANDLHDLDRQNTERETGKVAVESVGVNNSLLNNKFDSSPNVESLQPVLPTSSNSYERYPQSLQPMHHGDPVGQYHVSRSVVEDIPTTMPPRALINQDGVFSKGHPPVGLPVHNSEIPPVVTKKKVDSLIEQASDQGKVLYLETPSSAPTQLFDGYMKNNFPEATAVVTMPEGYPIPPTKKDQLQNYEDGASTSNSGFAPTYVDSQSNAVDFSSLNPPPLPERVYYSERIPREQVDLLNRSTKSDDLHGSQFNISDLLSDAKPSDSVTGSDDNLHNGNQPLRAEESGVAAKPLPADGYATKHQIYKHFPDPSSQLKSKLTEHVNSELKKVVPIVEGSNDVVTKDHVVNFEPETYCKDNHIKHRLDEIKDSKSESDFPTLHQVPSARHLEDPASCLPEVDWGNATVTESNESRMVQGLPVSLNGNQTTKDDFQPSSSVASKTSQGFSGRHPLTSDGVGLSINVKNHEPTPWEYFHKLAQEGLNNVSLIDQDHVSFSPAIEEVEDDGRTQHVTPLTTGEIYQKDLHGRVGTETTILKPNDPLVKDTESMQFNAIMENIRAQESVFEDGKFETRNRTPPVDPPVSEIDPNSLQVIMNEDLEELKELGSGTFGTVYHGKWRGTDVAIKRIKKSCFTGRSSEQERLTLEFWREADILSKLHHPNVVAFYGVVQDGPGGTMATVTEYMVDGSLRHVLLRKDRYLDRRKRLIIAMDAAFGMEYLHSKNIVHFDLKCDNLLVNLKDPLRPICKVGDFGLSKIKRNTLVSGGVRGTLPWMAPELLNGSSNKVSEKVDVFSFGIVLWEILTGEEPYANMHYGAIIGGIVNNTLRPTIPSYCDSEWRTLMEQCWAPNPAVRPSFTEIARRLRVMSVAASQAKVQGQKASK
ncbi:uncharacterized protein LOC107612789 isoform X2 [Arachis ipaensis]|uniref:uncharacterized protein LOC107612789 isoform X2 n=1 Tax=Arachis ipaensis TaxID=130454 RepID=UPI0007AF262F|nr:uncharacterized protein LOC107612789 isoform X2 [Arachis ipaensis]XP_025671404.1 uncharacterized protein LOC112771048 isoform X2 [Arachis hypogaea]